MINREKWAELIKDFHEKKIPDLVERHLKIPGETPLKRAITIIGPRRAGKTYRMYQIIKNLLENGIEIQRIFYINIERTDLEGCTNIDLINMLEVFYEIYPENMNKKIWLFFDEIQNVNEWEKAIRTILDNKNAQIFITGSSSKLLSKEIATSMRGRTISYTIHPFSFLEYLTLQKIKFGKYFSSSEKAVIMNKLREYMKNGGYPETLIYSEERTKILMDIFETTIYRDVVERYKIRNIKLLKLLIKALINSSVREFSLHKFYNFSKSSGIKASKNALYNYFDALSDVFFISPVRKFSYSYKEAEQSLPKIYIVDNGLLTLNGINDTGRLMESLVFLELKRRGKDIHYYKSVDGKEVDFLIKKANKIELLIQVSFSLDDINTRERELNALIKASKDLKCNNMLIITWDKEGKEKLNGNNIRYIPLWKWLLQ